MGMQIETLQITTEILMLIAEIDEFKGAWRALGLLAPEQLSSLKKAATIESIGSSTRIEGSKLTDKEVEALLLNQQVQNFATRDAQDVAGYAAVMDLVFQNFEAIALSENYIKQLHTLLLQHSHKDEWHRGNYKTLPNHVEAFDANGKSLGIVFETATRYETGLRMQKLIAWTNNAFAEKKLHPLLITGFFIVEFLAIHPFQDGNGRLCRVLTTFLMLQLGYAYVSCSSLEAILEQSKENYYLALRQTQVTIKTIHPNWQPWLVFFLKALQLQKHRLQIKLAGNKPLVAQLPPLSFKILELVKLKQHITTREVVTATNANRNTVKKHIETLVANNYLLLNGTGKGTWYTAAK